MRLASPLLLGASMTPTFNPALLHHITTQLENGRPIWALLWLNANFRTNDPLHRIILKQALAKLPRRDRPVLSQAIIAKIARGGGLSDLTQKEVEQMRRCDRKMSAAAVVFKRSGAIPAPRLRAHGSAARREHVYNQRLSRYAAPSVMPSSSRSSRIRSYIEVNSMKRS